MKRLFLLTSLLAIAQCAMAQWDTPPDVVQFLRDVGTDLANAHMKDPINESYSGPERFLDHFDSSMKGYSQLREYVRELISRTEIGSAIEVAQDSGDDHKREMKLDWTLEIHDQTMRQDRPPRRELVKCTIEKRGKTWKFVAFEPIELFKY